MKKQQILKVMIIVIALLFLTGTGGVLAAEVLAVGHKNPIQNKIRNEKI